MINVEFTNGVAYLTLNNPPINVLNAVLISELKEFAEKVALDKFVKVIVFQSSNPEFFIAHGDMNFVTDPASFMNLADSEGGSFV
ncbi:enoyl-CoA hydratase-related protein [Chryseobacterium soldanellicola]|uniref:enoyl-CoA hydratase-related protein n=1 Tax=Chryseobacterium soldanellicola TaxID=311333 RepID=UPI001E4F5F6C|nr:enoyl-CoA hydratase-related protein [Chryseobacterium soldanellicola]